MTNLNTTALCSGVMKLPKSCFYLIVTFRWLLAGSCTRKCNILYFLLLLLTADGKIEKNEMGGSCGAAGGGARCAQGVGGEARGKYAIGETQT
jgi:hypothetical protein